MKIMLCLYYHYVFIDSPNRRVLLTNVIFILSKTGFNLTIFVCRLIVVCYSSCWCVHFKGKICSVKKNRMLAVYRSSHSRIVSEYSRNSFSNGKRQIKPLRNSKSFSQLFFTELRCKLAFSFKSCA